MPAEQAPEQNRMNQPHKRPRSGLAGWLVIFMLTQVGINLAKQHYRAMYSEPAHRIVAATPRRNPRMAVHRNAQKWTQQPCHGIEPILYAKRAHMTRVEPNKTPYSPQRIRAQIYRTTSLSLIHI